MDFWLLAIPSASTLLAALGGYWLAGRNEEKRDLRALSRTRDERLQDRKVVDERARHELQLQTLLELQDAIQTAARHFMRIVHHDHMKAREGKFTMLPEGYSEDLEASRTNVRRLMSRVLDDALRTSVASFVSGLSDLTLDPRRHYVDAGGKVLAGQRLESAADAAYARASSLASNCMERIGTAIRREISWTSDG